MAQPLSATYSNQEVVPDSNITFDSDGQDRTMTVRAAARRSGTAEITVTVDDGTDTTTLKVTVMVGAPNPDMITGTNGGDGDDTLLGKAGRDDLTGGIGAESFSGGQGTDTAADFDPGEVQHFSPSAKRKLKG